VESRSGKEIYRMGLNDPATALKLWKSAASTARASTSKSVEKPSPTNKSPPKVTRWPSNGTLLSLSRSRQASVMLKQSAASPGGSISSPVEPSASTKKKNRKTKVIFNWPMPRQEWVDGQYVEHHEKNDEAWVELFIDLIYVVLLSSLANQLEIGHVSTALFFKITLSFWIMCLTRQAIDEYSNRFYCHDFVQKCVYFVYTIAVLIQAMAIQFDYLRQASADGGDEHVSAHGHLDALWSSYSSTAAPSRASLSALNAESSSEGSDEATSTAYFHDTTYSSSFALSLLITRVCLLFSKYPYSDYPAV
jgi:hypothetical protein